MRPAICTNSPCCLPVPWPRAAFLPIHGTLSHFSIGRPLTLCVVWRQGGLRTADSIDYFLMAAWLAMAAAEVDGYRSNSCAHTPGSWLPVSLSKVALCSCRHLPQALAAVFYLRFGLLTPGWACTDAKYSKEQRSAMRSQFYTKYLSQEKMWSAPEQVRS